jgi:DNA-directed RNA polymerase specialized sigma24 family protein
MDTLEMPVCTANSLEREKLFTSLYQSTLPSVARFISSRKGSWQDAKDIFHDALMIYYEKTVNKQVEITVSDEAYILGIAKHLWLRKYSQDKKHISFDTFEAGIMIPENYFAEILPDKIMQFLERTGKKCMELLTAFYYQKHSMQQIAAEFNFGTERSATVQKATVQKYKCLEKIRDTVKQTKKSYEDFTE